MLATNSNCSSMGRNMHSAHTTSRNLLACYFLWDFNSMWIIWSGINGALKRLSAMRVLGKNAYWSDGGNRIENVVRCNYVRNMRSSEFCVEPQPHRPSIHLEKLLSWMACPIRRTVPSRKKSRNRISWLCHVELWIHTGRVVFNQPRPSDISYTRWLHCWAPFYPNERRKGEKL